MANSGDYDTRDEDRLPWLETVEADYDQGPAVLRIVLLVALGVALLAAAVYAYSRYEQSRGVEGNGDLIAAQEGDYKVKPDDPGGLKVEGEGDSAIATSDGTAGGNAVINVDAAPEAPVTGTKAKPGTSNAMGGSKAVVAVPASGGKLTATPPTQGRMPAANAASSGGALVQLGSFASEAEANAGWAKSSKRFTYLEPLGKSVQKAEVNGRTVYRLRVNAGSAGQASALCGKLKVAGEACFVASN
ncbi:SPOR domain-containing protein [Sphingomonas endolithica]|uniref:SPOR domain-containing protein n=1 Tax=Sphingomonas endolithica TaxID=2972485 RepID=UPI0021AE61FA|nr:SPOR domain-containing protein [Sphingomonas sp. ZFBP2030]